MIFKNLTRRREIGANCYLLEKDKTKLIIDSGMHPKLVGYDATPEFSLVPTEKATAIFLSHAHHDHLGALPIAQRRQPQAPVYMTEATGEVASAMLHNSVNVMISQRDEENIQDYPLFTHKEVDQQSESWYYCDIKKTFTIPNTDIQATFYDAGHILGSAGILFRDGEHKLFYTGDANFENQTICRAAQFPKEHVDVLIMETTRGAYQRPEGYSRKKVKESLAAQIKETFDRNGSVLIPVFALGKTQEVLVMLHELHEEGLIPEIPVHLGGLSTKISLIYDELSDKVERHYKGFRILEDIDMLVPPRRRKTEIIAQPRCIYALSSGMMSEGTISNNFAQKFVQNPDNSVIFVGYTDVESPGHLLKMAKPGEQIKLSKKHPAVTVNARVENYDLSAHATREDLLAYAISVTPKKVILVHGDEPAQIWFEEQIKAALPETEVLRPEPGKEVVLW
jgi:Cft2 family RNA processing exonuclease